MNERLIEIEQGTVHIVEHGNRAGRAVVFLHGWPQSSACFEGVLRAAGEGMYCVAIDLPGIGGSGAKLRDGRKTTIAAAVRDVLRTLALDRVVLAGHDIGGQVVFAYLTQYADELESAVIMNVVVPGIPPWDEVIRNPFIWHFAFHNVPALPETLVSGRERRKACIRVSLSARTCAQDGLRLVPSLR